MAIRHPQLTLAVASGKGGTGKTLVSSNLAALAESKGTRTTLVDCDVEAPNDHLFFERLSSSLSPVTVEIAEVNAGDCVGCGACRDACAYGGLRLLGQTAIVFEELCHGCGLCASICPARAISHRISRIGDVETWRLAGRSKLKVVTGRLHVGQVKTPSVIRAARAAAAKSYSRLVILDSPPGVACAAVAAMRGADALLLVTEPTLFGMHDLELSLRLGADLKLPMGVLVNRDIEDASTQLERLCGSYSAPILGRIPFDRRVAEAYATGRLVAEELPEIGLVLEQVLDGMAALSRRAVT